MAFEKENMEFTWNLQGIFKEFSRNFQVIFKEKTILWKKDLADSKRVQIINFPIERLRLMLICLLRKYIVFSQISHNF